MAQSPPFIPTVVPSQRAAKAVARALAGLVLCVGVLLSSAAPASAADWPPEPCTSSTATLGYTDGDYCFAGRVFRSRGWLYPQCLMHPAAPGVIYPYYRYCGGAAKKGIEAIAQARAVTRLGSPYGGIGATTQWETHIKRPGRPNLGRADILDETAEGMYVWEAKRTGSNWGNPSRQAQEYVDGLQSVGYGHARVGTQTSGRLAGYEDHFLLPDFEAGTCSKDGSSFLQFRVYAVWISDPGVLAVDESPLLECFDPATEPVKVPTTITTGSGPTTPAPWEDIRGSAGPFPAPTSTGLAPPGPGASPTGPGPGPGGGPGTAPGSGFGGSWGPTIGAGSGAGTSTSMRGGLAGDPHLTSFDGLALEFHSVGEFQAAKSDQLDLDVQVRLAPAPGSTILSIVDRIAFMLNASAVEIGLPNDDLLIDGSPVALSVGAERDLGNGASIRRTFYGYKATWPGEGTRPSVETNGTIFEVSVPAFSPVRGLLGSPDGDVTNDVTTGLGKHLQMDSSSSVIHGTLADSWRISDDESLFTYAAGQTTETFSDYSFPANVAKLSDVSESALTEGTSRCTNAGVVDGPQFDDCVLDWAITGDAEFIESAAARVTPMIEAGAVGLAPDGWAAEDFEGTIPPNFSGHRYGTAPGASTFAGPFGRTGRYGFYVPELPAHTEATVTLDLLTFGTWSSFDSSAAEMTFNGQVVWRGNPAALVPSKTGTTETGQPYAVYPLSVSAPHLERQLNVGVGVDLQLGSLNAFAVDNVRATTNEVPAQTFDVGPQVTVSDGVPNAGAGNLETAASEDVYRFTTSDSATVQVALSECAASLGTVTWKLVDAASGETLASRNNCADQSVNDVPAGTYKLSVTDSGSTGTYKLKLLAAAKQRFDVSLPASISDGAPAPGAGNLETTASQDEYAFTTTSTGTLQIDLPSCSAGVSLSLRNAATGQTVFSMGWTCSSHSVPLVPPGAYTLSVARPGAAGNYRLALSTRATPQVFDVSSPTTVSDGTPSAGAGNLETTSSEDVYRFTTDASSTVQVGLSQCSASLGTVTWKLVNLGSGETLTTKTTCSDEWVENVPAGSYKVSITDNGSTGTYRLRLLAEAKQQFELSLPGSISDGVPAVGAGNLETTASQDDYTFTTSTTGLQVDLSACSSSVNWSLRNVATGQTVFAINYACSSRSLPTLPAGTYTLSVFRRTAATGTYKLGVLAVPAPQVFDVAPPASISDGSPSSGAGNLETTASEDVYRFTTGALSTVQVRLSHCAASLGTVTWKLVNSSSGQTLATRTSCSDEWVEDVPAGSYKLSITDNGSKGTYTMQLLAEAKQRFDLSLPATISDGVPAAGAGNLETTASQDDYTFTTSTAGTLQVDFSACSSSVNWSLRNVTTGQTVFAISYACSSRSLTNLPAGTYTLSVFRRTSATGTYKLGIARTP